MKTVSFVPRRRRLGGCCISSLPWRPLASVQVRTHTQTHTHTTHARTHTCKYIHTCTHTHTYIHMHTQTLTNAHPHNFKSIDVCANWISRSCVCADIIYVHSWIMITCWSMYRIILFFIWSSSQNPSHIWLRASTGAISMYTQTCACTRMQCCSRGAPVLTCKCQSHKKPSEACDQRRNVWYVRHKSRSKRCCIVIAVTLQRQFSEHMRPRSWLSYATTVTRFSA